ncbi:MAG: ABC transporter ATP-binding protein, partial [Clostridia bacterium]|nr:ABC transporter ATP-binding protein [Clostridia bacterium]
LCENFGVRKRWVWLWALADGIPALIWGFSSKYKPQWTVPEMDKDAEIFFSGNTANVLENGLTVNLEKRTAVSNFKKKTLLRDIHLSVEPGHMVLLLGGSGAGKTTLVNAINGYEKADAKVMLNGGDLYADYKKMMYEIGFVPQQDLMRENDTVNATLADAAMLRLPAKFTAAERNKRVDEVLELFGLTPLRRSLVGKLSGGQRKRLSIAMEFLSNPTLFILDEPDSGLDGVMARGLMQQLHDISRQGKIVIVITHTPDRVIDLFDDVIVLAKDSTQSGRLAYFGPIDEAKRFFERDTMEQIVRCINRPGEGGEGRADEFVKKFAEVQKNG